MLKPENKTATRRVYDGHVVGMRLDTVETALGKETIREVVEHSECVAVVVIDEDDNVLLVRQFRYAVGKFLLEIPAGGIDPGEDPLDTVHRELQEEIGHFPRRVEQLGGFYAIPGYGTEYLHCFLATDLVSSRLVAEDTEGIEIVRVPLGQIPQFIASGQICDAKSIAALLMFLFVRQGR